jgi:hypothetical protein
VVYRCGKSCRRKTLLEKSQRHQTSGLMASLKAQSPDRRPHPRGEHQ